MDSDIEFAFEKKLGIPISAYGDTNTIVRAIELLMVCMKDTNMLHGVECEFFRIDFRKSFSDEDKPLIFESLILNMQWGSKKELEKKKQEDKHEV